MKEETSSSQCYLLCCVILGSHHHSLSRQKRSNILCKRSWHENQCGLETTDCPLPVASQVEALPPSSDRPGVAHTQRTNGPSFWDLGWCQEASWVRRALWDPGSCLFLGYTLCWCPAHSLGPSSLQSQMAMRCLHCMIGASGLITSQILGPTGRQEVVVMASTMGYRGLCSTSRRLGLECSSSRDLNSATLSKHADAVLMSSIRPSDFSLQDSVLRSMGRLPQASPLTLGLARRQQGHP